MTLLHDPCSGGFVCVPTRRHADECRPITCQVWSETGHGVAIWPPEAAHQARLTVLRDRGSVFLLGIPGGRRARRAQDRHSRVQSSDNQHNALLGRQRSQPVPCVG